MNNRPTFKEALHFWIRLGFISFGGPAGQIAIMHEYLVTKKKWISESKFLHALNYCMLLPGPEAQQLATYIGWLLHGNRGGLAAGIFFILPSMLILLGLSIAYSSFSDIPWVYAMFAGLKPAVVAIVILALFKIGKKSLSTSFHYFIALAAFICIFYFNIPFPIIILGAFILSFLVKKFLPNVLDTGGSNKVQDANEEEYFINKHTVIPNTGFIPLRFLKQITMAGLCWFVPFVIFFIVAEDFIFWKNLILFFTQAAFVTFGGAYAVLPYVAQMSVEKFHWLSSYQMLDGLALGETTPGPLIMVLAFVGFMAGYNHFCSSLFTGTIGLLTTTYYTFLPSFLFILIGANVIERTNNNKTIKELLSLVTAAVVGVILNLCIYLGKAIVFPENISINGFQFYSFIWILISLLALHRFKMNMLLLFLISVVFGLISHYFLN